MAARLILMGALGWCLNSCNLFLPPSEPKFGSRTVPDRTFTRGLAIDALTLPPASGGAGTVRYGLTPEIPGLHFAPGRRVLWGTPSAAGSYRMTYRATDEQGRSATLKFALTVIGAIGDRPATATVIRPGSPIRGRLEPATDAHYFKVEVRSPATLIAATDGNDRYADTVVSIEGVPGHEPNTSESIDAAQAVAPGTYHVRVQLHPDGSRSAREYALAVWLLGAENDGFDIEVRFVGEQVPPVASEAVIENAARRWERILRENGATAGQIVASSRQCRDSALPFGSYVDDLLIYVYLWDLNGPAARAGPCFSRAAQADGAPGLPYVGTIWFDPKHLAPESLYFTALHEIGHVLGFGTVWDRFGYLQHPAAGSSASPPPDTHFSGALAGAAFDRAGGARHRGAKVPVENDTARYRGAADVHWRESVFGAELMTGGVRGGRGSFEPLSRVTVASLADLGYAVDYAAADAFRLPRPGSALREALQRGTIHFRGDTFPEPPAVAELPEKVVRVLRR